MRKLLPLFLFLIGLGVLLSGYLFVFKSARKVSQQTGLEIEKTQEIPLLEKPLALLIPRSDGHWLKLKIEKMNIANAESLDYELLYELPDGRTQGVPGTISLNGQKEIERDLLLGSESSGKFRYDEGVAQGTLTIKFRDRKGKLIAKFSTKFHLQSNAKSLTSLDGKFSYTLDAIPKKTFFVIMETFGLPSEPPSKIVSGPYAVFGSSKTALSGSAKLEGGAVYKATGSSWEKIASGESKDIGIFIATSE